MKLKHEHSQFRIVVANFAENATMKYYDDIMDKVEDIDVGLFVVNAALLQSGPLIDSDAKACQAMLNTNVYQYGAMLHKITERLDQRPRNMRSGIIFVDSITAEGCLDNMVLYCATKVFAKYLCMSTDYENKVTGRKNIDILCTQPGYLHTPESKDVDPTSVLLSDFVSGTFRDLGHEVTTFGTIYHEIIGRVIVLLTKHKH